MFTVWLRHKDKIVRCWSFVVWADSLTLLEIPDIKLLGILNIFCGLVEDQQTDRKSDSHPIQKSSSSSCKANTSQQVKIDNVDVADVNSDISDYFRFNINRWQKVSKALMQKIYNEFGDFFSRIGCFKVCLGYKWMKAADHTKNSQKISVCASGTPKGGAGQNTQAINNSAPGCG